MVISRTYFCECCHKSGRPDNGDLFAIRKGTQGQVVIRTAESVNRKDIPFGFVPHFMELDKVKNNECIVTVCCGIIGCGCEIVSQYDELGQQYYDVEFKHKRKIIMTIEDWNAVVMKFRGWTGYNL